MKTFPCKGCGKPIVWGQEIGTGTKIPLDPRAPVYAPIQENIDGTVRVARHAAAMVTHFATCPKATDFSRSKKPAGGAS